MTLLNPKENNPLVNIGVEIGIGIGTGTGTGSGSGTGTGTGTGTGSGTGTGTTPPVTTPPVTTPPVTVPPVLQNSVKVAVVIPVGKYHAALLPEALESVLAQKLSINGGIGVAGGVACELSITVVNDAGLPYPPPVLELLKAAKTSGQNKKITLNWLTSAGDTDKSFDAPWFTFEPLGAGAARNAGLIKAHQDKCEGIIFLDADDKMYTECVVKLTQAYLANGKARYIYSDFMVEVEKGRALEANPLPEYDDYKMQNVYGTHHTTCFMPVSWLINLPGGSANFGKGITGGMDAGLSGFEFWEMCIRLALYGRYGKRLAEPLFIYRKHYGKRYNETLNHEGELRGYINGKQTKMRLALQQAQQGQ